MSAPTSGPARKPFVAPIRPRNLLWLVVVGGGWVLAQLYGTPHLRVQYTWSGTYARPVYHACDYWGLYPFHLRPINGVCPLFVLAKKG